MKITKDELVSILKKSTSVHRVVPTTYGTRVIVFKLNAPDIYRFNHDGKFVGHGK